MSDAVRDNAINSTMAQANERSLLPFIGSEVQVPYQQARAIVLPIPFEATTTYRKGCQHGPASLLEASDQLEYYDDEFDCEICWPVGIHTSEAVADTRGGQAISPETMVQVTQNRVAQYIADGKFVIAIGGEHSITRGVIQAYHQAYPTEPFTVVQIDAHADLRPEYEGSENNHACVMRRVVELGLPTLHVGIRHLCQEEADFIKTQQLPVMWGREIATDPHWIERALAAISTEKVFVTIDLDGLDPSLIPGVGTPDPGGLSWYQTTAFLRQIFASHQVLGCDIMELAPVMDSVVSQYTAAKLLYKAIGYKALAAQWLATRSF
jgi:agmatinase